MYGIVHYTIVNLIIYILRRVLIR